MRMRAYGLDAAGTRQSAYRAKRIKIFLYIGSHMGTHVREKRKGHALSRSLTATGINQI